MRKYESVKIIQEVMSGQPFLRVPVNPRLKFGVLPAEVCKKDILHPGLRELFLKAYLSAGGHDRAEEEQFNGLSKTPYVLEALKAGPKGQGSLADRLSLKLRVESGKWIIATQVPAGSPLWLLRHFLGCLPRPLLHGSDWGAIAVACGAVSRPKSNHHEDEVLEKISTALEALPKANCLILVALVLLIRNLSAVKPTHDSASQSVILHEETVEALSQYFTAAIISRPYRPGLCTTLDREHKPLLVFLSEHWLEVKELCQHTGISRYHNTCESGYEFVSSDTEVDHTMKRTLATGEDIDEEILQAPDSLARRPDEQLPEITSPQRSISHCAVEEARISKKEVEPIDLAMTPNIQETEIPVKTIPVTVQMPKGVYFIHPKAECIHTSVVDEEAAAKVTEEFSDTVVLADKKLNRGYIQLDDHKIDYFGYILLRKVAKDENNKNPKFDVKNLISKYEHEAMVSAVADQVFRCDGLPRKRKVTVKINGTQTFACEFSEDGQAMEVEKLQERTNELQGSPGRVKSPQNSSRQQRPEQTIGPSNELEFSKICGKRTSIPLTKSTALLIKNLTSNQEMVYWPTTSNLIALPNGKVISEAEQVTSLKENSFTSRTHKDEKVSMNPVKDMNKLRYQKTHSNYSDFVTESKNNFKEGRRKPSLAKLSSSRIFLEDESRGLDVVTNCTGQGTSEVLRMGEFLGRKLISFRGSAGCRSAEELVPKTCFGPISSANFA